MPMASPPFYRSLEDKEYWRVFRIPRCPWKSALFCFYVCCWMHVEVSGWVIPWETTKLSQSLVTLQPEPFRIQLCLQHLDTYYSCWQKAKLDNCFLWAKWLCSIPKEVSIFVLEYDPSHIPTQYDPLSPTPCGSNSSHHCLWGGGQREVSSSLAGRIQPIIIMIVALMALIELLSVNFTLYVKHILAYIIERCVE